MTTVAAVVLAYALGCVATGYYVVRALTGEDVRSHATGSSGARNVTRRAGLAAGAATFAADLAKGAAAVALAGAAAGDGAAAAALVAVVLGHVAPVQLRFRGGRGLGPGVGGLAVLDWRLAVIALAVAALVTLATRAFTGAGVAGAATAPVAAAVLGEWRIAAAAALALLLIAAAHARRAPLRRLGA
ncbi:MAG TPA: glycerol-3-phosphate acyltransferase [Gaiellales bacterium]